MLFLTIFDKSLIVLSATSGVPIGISSASFSLEFSIATRNIKKMLETTRN